MPPNLLLQNALMQGNMIDARNIMQQEEAKWYYMADMTAEEERRRKEEQVRVYQPEPIRYEPLGIEPLQPISVEPLLVSSFRKRSEEGEETGYSLMLRVLDKACKAEEIRLLKSLQGDNSW